MYILGLRIKSELNFFVYNVPGTVLRALNGLFQLILRTTLGDNTFHFTCEEAGIKGSYVTCTRFPRSEVKCGPI